MASKSLKRLTRRERAERAAERARAVANGEDYKPKPGPGQVIAKIGGDDGREAKRLRNMGASALMLAHHRGQLDSPNKQARITAQDRLLCGEIFERQWHLLHASHSRDSTDLGRGGGGIGGGFTDAQQDAGRAVERYKTRMEAANWRIVRAFCGEGYAPAAALRVAGVEVHPVGTFFRIREAMDDLIRAVTGMREYAGAVDKGPKQD